MNLFGRYKAYGANADPLAAACNSIALLVAWNQPFYPFYVHWIVGGDAWLACITWLSTPFFLAVPFVARRSSMAGRALLPIAGIGNTVLSSWAFGPGAGVALFLIPCALIAAFAFRRSERRVAVALVLLALATAIGLRLIHAVPLGHYDADAYERFFHLNGYSAVMLSAIVAWSFRKPLDSGVQPSARVAR